MHVENRMNILQRNIWQSYGNSSCHVWRNWIENDYSKNKIRKYQSLGGNIESLFSYIILLQSISNTMIVYFRICHCDSVSVVIKYINMYHAFIYGQCLFALFICCFYYKLYIDYII